MAMSYLLLLLLGISVVSARTTQEKKAEDHSSSLYSGSSMKTSQEKEYKKQPLRPERNREGDLNKRFIISAIATGALLLTRVTEFIDSASSYNDRLSFLMGLGGESSSPAEEKDIQSLKKQLSAMDTFMKSSFAQVLSGQEFGQVILNYNRYIHHLQSVVLLDVLEHMGDEAQLTDEPSQELAREITGGMNADRTEFALFKIHEMLTGKSIVQLGSLYEVVGKKNAACIPPCTANLYNLPILASQFNKLQSAAYGALEAAMKKEGQSDKATALKETLKERATAQVKKLYLAQEEFRKAAGSGSSFLRLRSAVGGCFAYKSNIKAHLRDCDDPDVLKVKITKDRDFLYGDSNKKCFSGQLLPTKNEYCTRNKWNLKISKVDPRFVSLLSREEDRCLKANIGDEVTDNGKKYKNVDLGHPCAALDEEEPLGAASENQFWEFIPDTEEDSE